MTNEKIIERLEKERKHLNDIGPKNNPDDPNTTAMARGFMAGLLLVWDIMLELNPSYEELRSAIESYLFDNKY